MTSQLVFLHPHFLKQGGATKVVLEQIAGLSKKGVKCIVITTAVDPKVIRPYGKIKTVKIGPWTTGDLMFWITFPLFYLNLQRMLKGIEPKYIYCHSLSIYWGAIYKFFHPKTRVIYYFHDLGMPYTDSLPEMSGLPLIPRLTARLTLPLFSIINKAVIESADFMIANSLASSKFILNKYSRRPDIIVSPGIDTRIFKPKGPKQDYIFTVGRLERIKNIDLIIKGFADYLLDHDDSKLSLLIVGEGIERGGLLRLVENLNIAERVKFLGQLPTDELSEIATKSKLGIFMCPNESFGLAVVESLACGTPVIGINKNGIRELVEGDNGLLVSGNPRAIARALDKLLSHPKTLSEMSVRASVNAREKYDWKRQINGLYSWLIKLD